VGNINRVNTCASTDDELKFSASINDTRIDFLGADD